MIGRRKNNRKRGTQDLRNAWIESFRKEAGVVDVPENGVPRKDIRPPASGNPGDPALEVVRAERPQRERVLDSGQLPERRGK